MQVNIKKNKIKAVETVKSCKHLRLLLSGVSVKKVLSLLKLLSCRAKGEYQSDADACGMGPFFESNMFISSSVVPTLTHVMDN